MFQIYYRNSKGQASSSKKTIRIWAIFLFGYHNCMVLHEELKVRLNHFHFVLNVMLNLTYNAILFLVEWLQCEFFNKLVF